MKAGISALALIFGLGGDLAWADCSDTLYLQKIVVYQQSLKNDTALSSWDKFEVNPWIQNDLVNAGPVGFSYINDGPDTAMHLMRFQYNCGSDSVSSVLYGRVVDSLRVKGEGYTRVRYSDTTRQSVKSVMNNGQGKGVVLPFNGELINFAVIWDVGDEQIGKIAGGSARESWSANFVSYAFQKVTGAFSYSVLMTPRSVRSAKAISDADLRFHFQSVQPNVAKLGTAVDSVRTAIRVFQYVYDLTQPTTGLTQMSPIPSLHVYSEGDRYKILLNQPEPVSIVSPSGHVARRFDANRSVVWDLRDQTGVRVAPGIWFLQIQGVKAIPVFVQ